MKFNLSEESLEDLFRDILEVGEGEPLVLIMRGISTKDEEIIYVTSFDMEWACDIYHNRKTDVYVCKPKDGTKWSEKTFFGEDARQQAFIYAEGWCSG